MITAILDDGRRIAREVDDVPGFVGRPMQRANVEWKFRGNVGRRWPEGRTAAVLQAALSAVADQSKMRMQALPAARAPPSAAAFFPAFTYSLVKQP